MDSNLLPISGPFFGRMAHGVNNRAKKQLIPSRIVHNVRVVLRSVATVARCRVVSHALLKYVHAFKALGWAVGRLSKTTTFKKHHENKK